MHRVSRASLAAIVCPAAPLLAPRLLRAGAPIALNPSRATCTPAAAPPRSRACYATQAAPKGKRLSGRERWQRRADRLRRQPVTEHEASLRKLCKAVELRDLPQMMLLYPSLAEARLLTHTHARNIAQALHFLARQQNKPQNLAEFIDEFVTDLYTGALPPHPYAFVHVLGVYRDLNRFDEALQLWQWLVPQGDSHVSQATYGSAIELMAVAKRATLPELEELYRQGLERFPGTFAAYHLSPDAIVPDRTQPVVVPDIPTVMFQGICTARILARDWKNAYLALDTILRLYPTQTPPRFFELFLTERPLSEAYTAVMIACRAGIIMSPGRINTLLHDLKQSLRQSRSMSDRVKLWRAMVNAIYAYQQAGGEIQVRHSQTILSCCSRLLPPPSSGEDFVGESAQIRKIIALTAREIVKSLSQASFSEKSTLFEAVISIAGHLRDPDLLATTIQDMKSAGAVLRPEGITSALYAAGVLKDQAMIPLLWQQIVSNANAEGAQIDFKDWTTFTKACRKAGLVDYFHEQMSKLAHTTTSTTEKLLVEKMNKHERSSREDTSPFEHMPVEEFAAQMEGLKEQLKNVEAVIMSGSPLDLQRSPFHMHIDPSEKSISSLENLRAVYDEMTLDPHQPPPQPTADGSVLPPTLSSTGIPLDELRFLNWLSIVEMMDEADMYEKNLNINVDQAISAGKPFTPNRLVFQPRGATGQLKTKAEVREKIRALRTASPETSKVGKVESGE